jgi:hypothetical protein
MALLANIDGEPILENSKGFFHLKNKAKWRLLDNEPTRQGCTLFGTTL